MEQKTKKMPFAPVKVRREKTEKKLTERQRAAQKRQAEQNRKAAPAKGVPSAMRQQKLNPNKVRITNLIAGELARAFAVILKLDGPADTLMKAFFKSNPKLGSRDRTILAEAIFYALRHYSEIAWRMKPVKPERAPKVAAFLTLAMQYGVESMGDQVLGSEKGPVTNMLGLNLEKAPPEVRAPALACVLLSKPDNKGSFLKEKYQCRYRYNGKYGHMNLFLPNENPYHVICRI